MVIGFRSHRFGDHLSRETPNVSDEFTDAIEIAEELLWITRDSNLQQAAVRELDSLMSKLETQKEHHVKAECEDSANFVLGLQCVVGSTASELRMYQSLCQEAASEAWDWLVSSQVSAVASAKAHESLTSWSDARHIRLFNIECVMFPYQTFMSIGGVYDDMECSICKIDLMKCDHEPGKRYMGEFCTAVVKAMTLDEVSIVANPASKNARVTTIDNKDTLTGRVVQLDEG